MDIWTDFANNGVDCGAFGDWDRDLQEGFDRVVARPRRECKFCKNNGEPEETWSSPNFRDSQGKLSCPILRCYTCPICGAKGDRGHTLKYCPKKKILTESDIARMQRKPKRPRK